MSTTMENPDMRLAKLAASIRQRFARRGRAVAVDQDSWTFAFDPTVPEAMPILARVTDDGFIEILSGHNRHTAMTSLDTNVRWRFDPEGHQFPIGSLLPETVDADFGLKIPLTASDGSG